MFLPIIIIVFGTAVLLNAMGILSGSFWGVFLGDIVDSAGFEIAYA